MMTFTRDPITLNDVRNLDVAPFVVEGQGAGMIKIYFESEANKQEYLQTEVHSGVQSAGLKKIFDEMADNPNTGSIN
jgi:preprotein translocase subunit Sec61beta